MLASCGPPSYLRRRCGLGRRLTLSLLDLRLVTYRPPVDVDPFRAIAISHLAQLLRLEGRSIIHMEFGQPSAGAPAGAIAAAHRMLDEQDEGYGKAPGCASGSRVTIASMTNSSNPS